MTKRLVITFIFILHNLLVAQGFNRPVPENLYPYQFNSSVPITGFLLTTPLKLGIGFMNPNFKSPCPTIMDANGYVFWYFDNNALNNGDFKYFPDDSVFTFTRYVMGNAFYHILDLNLNSLGVISHTLDVNGDAHDIKILPNGHYIIGATRDSIMDLSSYMFNGTPGSSSTVVKACIIQEFDEMLNLVFEWNSLNYIHPSECNDSIYGYNAADFDYCHFNAVEQDDDGHLLISFRHLDAVYKINHITGDVIWILGGNSNQFTFLNDNGFSGQHDIRKLPNGNYSLFDNANSSPPPRKSRGVEYSIDTMGMTVTKTWEYIHTPSFFAKAMGNHTTTANEDHLISYGWVNRPYPNIVITDDAENVKTKITYGDSVVTYRTHWHQIPFAFTQPEISCDNTGSGIILTAPSGYTNYKWSTGDTTQSILVTSPDTFQVWVNFGVGMLGSQPIIIQNISLDCLTITLQQEENSSFSIMAYYDLLGREVMFPSPGNMYIVSLSNGKKSVRFIPH